MKNNGGVVRTLLVVRDEDLRSQLIQLLSARGWQHALADTPRAAARDAREGGFELAIVEIRRDIESNDLRRLCAIMGSRGRLLVIAEPPLLPGALDAGAAEFALPSDDRGTLDARLSLLQRAVDATRGRDQELHRLRAALESSASTREARNLFLAHMGHELRSPLGQILRHGDALFTRSCALEGAEGLLDDLQPVLSAGNRLLSLVEDVLDLSLLEGGRMRLQRGTFEVEPLARMMAHDFEPLATSAGIHFETQLQPELGTMQSDEEKLRRALRIILENAVQFTKGGKIELMVRREGDWLAFTVRDSGVGIAPKAQRTLMQPFVRFDRAATPGGAGMGLPIANHLGLLLGGELRFRSEPGRGSIFTLALPARAPLRTER